MGSLAFFRGVIVCFVISSICLAKDVYVQGTGGQVGHGQLRKFRDHCFVIVPKHLVDRPGNITIVAFKGVQAVAKIHDRDPDLDLAILKMDDSHLQLCSDATPLTKAEALDNLLQDATSAVVSVATSDGSRVLAEATIQEVNRRIIRVKLASKQDLRKGISGSTIVVKDFTAGIVFRDDEEISPAIFAYREDLVDDYWRRVMKVDKPCSNGCEAALSGLVHVKDYVLGDAPITDTETVQTRNVVYDSVYRLPEDWPFDPYLHVIRSQLKMFVPGVPAPAQPINIDSFNLSTSFAANANDFVISASGFSVTKVAQGILPAKWNYWTVQVIGGTEDRDMTIRFIPPQPLFQVNH